MYTDKLLSAISILLLALTTTTLNVEAQAPTPAPILLPGQWPPVNAPPPPVASWTALVDQTKLAKAPLRPPGTPCGPVDTFCVWSCTTCTRAESDFTFCPNKGDWALTYDDGPTPNTLTVLNALDTRGIKGTFFAIGSRVIENPQIIKQAVDNGHQVGVHTWSHTALTSQTTEEIIAEVKWTEMAIKQATGLTPKWFRPPQGDFDDRVRGILTQLGYKIAIWDRDTFDWQSNSDPSYDLNWIPGNFTNWVQNTTSATGFASLEHDAFNKTSSMTPVAMDIVLKAKFRPESVSVCLGDKQPYVENVQLPRSSIKGDNTTGTNPSVVSKNGTASIEKNVSLSIVCGLIMMIFGFIGTVYV
ncbi:Carbohydrate Esterase Family 4 protein [Glomus cerebriforme]|uniref:Carbohydrate Esterase Family 4 protein n=1 Tax=Glomus cerebriforme TaxID=658196 RepID=A0A397T193_9GLOM|nr:Carbohydrate Esterase Family 4 protein [Glomus cerebriforme]